MPDNQYFMVGALCLLFAITGGVGGYHLKSRMLDPGKPELTTGLPVSSALNSLDTINNINTRKCVPETIANTKDNSAPVLTTQLRGIDYTKRINHLIKQIHYIAAQQSLALNIDTQVKTEQEFVNLLDQIPDLIHPLLTVYQHMAESDTRDFFRSLLVTSGSLDIEDRAIEYLQGGDTVARSSWLALLRDKGVTQSHTREQLFDLLPILNNTQDIRDAILAISPDVVSSTERLDIVNHLSNYINHTDDIIRSAALESLSKWADNSIAYIFEQALNDSSERVRYSAISAAQSSGIHSSNIESILLGIMNNTHEDWQLRIHAHNVLSSYPLQGQNYDLFYKFRQQVIADENSNEARG